MIQLHNIHNYRQYQPWDHQTRFCSKLIYQVLVISRNSHHSCLIILLTPCFLHSFHSSSFSVQSKKSGVNYSNCIITVSYSGVYKGSTCLTAVICRLWARVHHQIKGSINAVSRLLFFTFLERYQHLISRVSQTKWNCLMLSAKCALQTGVCNHRHR